MVRCVGTAWGCCRSQIEAVEAGAGLRGVDGVYVGSTDAPGCVGLVAKVGFLSL